MASHSKVVWDEVGERFTNVGKGLRRRMKERGAKQADVLEADRKVLREGLRTLARDIGTTLDSISKPIRSPELREDLRKAAQSIGHALGETVTDLGEGVRDRLGVTRARLERKTSKLRPPKARKRTGGGAARKRKT
ncbi:MAG: hypothetical protein JST54_15115 [Deltaproteobacteria bacterium]|nr:hypothetical protein [Deltaproteobacteria bacterium]